MYILDATTRSLRLSISGSIATQLPFVTSYVLIGQNTFIPGTQVGSSNGANYVTFLSSPPAGTQSQLKFLSVYNPNAVECYAEIAYINNTTTSSIQKSRIRPYQTLLYTDGKGWYNNSANDISSQINHNSMYALQGGSSQQRYHLGLTTDGNQYSPDKPFLQISSDDIQSYTTSYSSGFNGQGYAISKSVNGYTAQFDNLRVRGSMDVYQMVINQIRATNGSLWVSDAGKATNATYSSTANNIALSFQTGSLLPFMVGDIVRSKRWGTSGSTTQSMWDITTTVSAVNYANGTMTISAPVANNSYTVTGSANGTWATFTNKINTSGSDWVRVGNTGSQATRRGSLYLTSNDSGGPFIDVYDLVTSSVEASNGLSNNVSGSKVKARLGKLDGIPGCSGYGLYSDNVFLTGTVSATAGTFSGKVTANQGSIGGWTINSENISSSVIEIAAGQYPHISMGTSIYGSANIYIGTGPGEATLFKVGNDSSYFKYIDNVISILASNFTLSSAGNMSANNAILSGSIQANTGYIGGASGWQIKAGQITTSGIKLLSGTTPYIGIGTTTYAGNGIWMGKGNKYSMSLYNDSSNYLKWNGANLQIKTANFTLSTAGNISASNVILGGTIYANAGTFAGTVTATAGSIGGWNLGSEGLSSSNVTISSQASSQSIRFTTASTALNLANSLNYIYLGKSGVANILNMVGSTATNYFKWDDNLSIQTPKFTLSSTALNIDGTITSVAGQIGGWTLGANGLSSSNVTISSQVSSQSIRITTASTALNLATSLNYIYLGKSNASNILNMVGDASNYFKWDGDLNIASPKLTLTPTSLNISGSITSSAGSIGGWTITPDNINQNSQIVLGQLSSYGENDILIGSNDGQPYVQFGDGLLYSSGSLTVAGTVSALAGSIGGWDITSDGIQNVHDNGTVSISTSGSGLLTLFDSAGNYTYSAVNSNLFSNVFNKQNASSNSIFKIDPELVITMSTSRYRAYQLSPDQGFGFKYTASQYTKENIFHMRMSGLVVGRTYIAQSRITNPSWDAPGIQIFTITNRIYKDNDFAAAAVYEFSDEPLFKYTVGSPGVEFSAPHQYAFKATDTTMYLTVNAEIQFGVVPATPSTFTYSGVRLDTFDKQYTELSQKGLILFNSPTSYLQLYSQNSNSTIASRGAIENLSVKNLTASNIYSSDPVYRNLPVMCNVNTTASADSWTVSKAMILQSLGVTTSYNITSPFIIMPYVLQGGTHTIALPNSWDSSYVRIHTQSGTNYLSNIIGQVYPSGTYSVAITCRLV